MTQIFCGAPSHVRLLAELNQHATSVNEMVEGPLPTDLMHLVDQYHILGQTTVVAEACLVSAFNALDPDVGAGVTENPDEYTAVKELAFSMLFHAGRQFDRLSDPFTQLVHGGGGWYNQPVRVDEQILYRNTFKTNSVLTPVQRQQEYENRVQKFLSRGGSFDSIVLLNEDNLQSLVPWSHYDYVMLPNLETRVYPTSVQERRGKPKAGHSLLVGTRAHFDDRLILSAGELWLLKDHSDEIEAVVIASNSGHFKPDFQSLAAASKGIEALGIPADRIVRFGGPNNIQAVFREVAALHGISGLEQRLPADPLELIEAWYD
jgi:hypothetical protein